MAASILGTVLLCLLGLLLVLLLAPAVLVAELRDGRARVWVRVLFLRFMLYPAKPRAPKKQKKKKTTKQQAEQKEAAEQPPKKRSAEEWLDLIRQTASAAGAGMRLLCKLMLVYNVEAVIPVELSDPAMLAQCYGQTQAAMGATRAALENLLHIRYKCWMAQPNFARDDKIQLVLACKVAVQPVIIIAAGGVALFQFFKQSGLWQRMCAVRAAKKRRKRLHAQRKKTGPKTP